MVERRRPQTAEIFLNDLGLLVAVFIRGHRSLEIARIGETVRADRTKLGKAERQPVVLGDITARFAVDLDPELDAARHKRGRTGGDLEDSELGDDAQGAGLRNDQQLAVGIGEDAPFHRAAGAIEVDRDAFEIGRVAVGEHRHHAVDEIAAGGKIGRRIPAQAVGRERILHRAGREQRCAFVAGERPVIRGRPQPIEPAAAVFVARRGERASGQLLGIESERRLLRGVATLRQSAVDGLAFEMPGEAGHVAQRFRHARGR